MVAVYRKGARRVAELLATVASDTDEAKSNGLDENARVHKGEQPGLST